MMISCFFLFFKARIPDPSDYLNLDPNPLVDRSRGRTFTATCYSLAGVRVYPEESSSVTEGDWGSLFSMHASEKGVFEFEEIMIETLKVGYKAKL